MSPEEVIQKHKDGTLNERQGIVALAREVIALREWMRELEKEQNPHE